MKILFSAFACVPRSGSEPGLGWNMSREIARYHDVWVLTTSENREAIEPELEARPVERLQFSYCSLPFERTWMRNAAAFSAMAYYYLWQIRALDRARVLHKEIRFDLVQHLTYMKYWAPSLMGHLGIPFVWGPVGGGESQDPVFDRGMSVYGRCYERARRVARGLGERDPLVRSAPGSCRIGLATTNQTAERLRAMECEDVRLFEGVGLTHETLAELSALDRGKPGRTRFVSIGRLLDWKGFHLGIEAFARAGIEGEYWVIGDGPARSSLEKLARRLGIADRVAFRGPLTRNETLRHLSGSTALVHPSLHDSGGSVCLEAMAAGRPVLCLDLGGPAQLVADGAGIKVPAGRPETTIEELAGGMKKLAVDDRLWGDMARKGRQHVERTFTWRARAQRLMALYESIL